jgi:hypothetical protein
MRVTLWKFESESKLKDRIDRDEAELADETDETPSNKIDCEYQSYFIYF